MHKLSGVWQQGAVGTAIVILGVAALLLGPILGSLAIKRGNFQATSQAIFPHEVSFSGWDFNYNQSTNTLVASGRLCFNTTLSSGRENLNLQASGPYIQGSGSSIATGTHTAGIGQYLCPTTYWYFSLASQMSEGYKQSGCPAAVWTLRMNSNRRGGLEGGYVLSIPHPPECTALPGATNTPIPTGTLSPTPSVSLTPTPTRTPTPTPSSTPTPSPLACPWPRPGQGANHPPDCFFKNLPEARGKLEPELPSDDPFSVDSSFRFHFAWKKPPIIDTLSQLPANIRSRIPSTGSVIREYRWTIYLKKSDGTITNCYQDERGFARRANPTSTGVDSIVEGVLPEICRELGSEFRGSVRVIYNVPDTRTEDNKFFDCCRVDEKFTAWVKGPVPTATPNQCTVVDLPNYGYQPQPEGVRQEGKVVARRLSGTEIEITNYGDPVRYLEYNFYRCACPGSRTGELKCSPADGSRPPASCGNFSGNNRSGGPNETHRLLKNQRVKITFPLESACGIAEFNVFALDENGKRIPLYTPTGDRWAGDVAFAIETNCHVANQTRGSCVSRGIPVFTDLPPVGGQLPRDASGRIPCLAPAWCEGTASDRGQCPADWQHFNTNGWCANATNGQPIYCCSPPANVTDQTTQKLTYDLTCDGKVSGEDISLALTSYGKLLTVCDGRSVILRAAFFSGLLSNYTSRE